MTHQPAPRILFRQQVPMRDGVHLCTDVYLPPDDGPRPAVVVRTPYGRNMQTLMRLAKSLNRSGCAVILQDCRGRYQSEGNFELELEAPDGLDTLGWAAQQPWCNGDLGLYGASIAAFPNYIVATSPLPEGVRLRALVSVMGSVSLHAVVYRGGALLQHWALPWTTMMDPGEMGQASWHQQPWPEVFRHLPLAEAPERFGMKASFWPQLVAHPARRHWSALDASPRLPELEVPTLHLAGWQDFMLGESLEAYQSISAAPQKLVVGPWDHGSVFTSLFEVSREAPTDFALVDVISFFFERWLLSGDDAAARAASRETQDAASAGAFLRRDDSAIVYVEEDGRWLDLPQFPPANDVAVEQVWYLSSQGDAHEADSDGALVPDRPMQMGRDTFRYDPDDPVPTVGGVVWPFPQADLLPGAADQSDVEQRADVLVYTGPTLEQDVVIAGSVEVELWASSSAPDTDFTAKLVELDLFGTPRIVQDAILRGRFATSLDREEPLAPGRPHRYRITLPALLRRFKAGHRLRLEISSSNFPKYDRHLNIAGALHSEARGLTADQTVHHGGATASLLRLRIMDPQQLDRFAIAS